MDKIFVSLEGYQEYLKELDQIREKIRKNSASMSEYMSDDAYGDGWHDNFAYEEARKMEYQLFLEYEKKLKGLNQLEIVKKKESDTIDLDTYFLFQFEDGEEEWYQLVGSTKSKENEKYMSITLNSPFGRSVYGKKGGDVVRYFVDGIEYRGVILDRRDELVNYRKD